MRERVQRARKKELTRRAVRPPEEGVEDAPALAVELVLRVAAVEVPHAAAHVERARAVPACVVHVCAEPVIRSDFADPGGEGNIGLEEGVSHMHIVFGARYTSLG